MSNAPFEARRMILGIQVVFVFENQIHRPAVISGLDLIVQQQIGV